MSSLEEKGYLEVKQIIPVEICQLFTQYALMRERFNFKPEKKDAQIPGQHSVYGDSFAETLAMFLQPHIEKETGLELAPTYTYYRVYRPGANLKRHKDRPSCQISATVCFGFEYFGMDEDYSWEVFVDPESVNKKKPDDEFNRIGEYLSYGNPGIGYRQSPGDAIIYKGCEIEHWREPFNAGEGSYQVQVFFHYIDKNGPFYPQHQYDGRIFMGSGSKL